MSRTGTAAAWRGDAPGDMRYVDRHQGGVSG
ncbi:hypothetical protein H4W31_002660 [Plantactinospora soyae]|uniref:Uncharacterized protein n=1 Tax=Plantactinospora soyae TaxID=1544732 RepID=A0A927QXR5_9ACTN|nr:hypothetical protein [Plantactinospora soyae]